MKIQFDHGSQSYSLDLTMTGRGGSASLEGQAVAVEVLHQAAGRVELQLRFADGRSQRSTLEVSSDGARRWVTLNGQTFLLTKSAAAGRIHHGHFSSGELAAPMPGQVRAVQVAEGQAVVKGQTLVILEAMKMEIKVAAPKDGKVRALKVKQGQTVERDQPLVEIV